MQTQNRLFDDLARVASGAFHTLGGLREEIELRVKERVERLAAEMDLVTREEQETMEARIAGLEERLGQLEGTAASKKRPASSRSAARERDDS